MKYGLLFAFTVAFNGAVYADDGSCINQDLASVQGLRPGATKEQDLPKNYLSMEAVSGEDDGGAYIGNKYKYEHYEIITVRTFIDSILITSPLLIWNEKIQIGMDRDKIENMLAYARVYKGKTSSQYLVCSNLGDVYAILDYNRGHLKSIEIAIDRP